MGAVQSLLTTSNTNNINTGTKRALLIGANYINSSNRLYGCVNDVVNVKSFLLANTDLNYSNDNITLMTDDPTLTPDSSLLPTKVNIIAQMKRLLALTSSGDTLFIHYSGHGEQLPDPSRGSYLNGEDDCLIPIDNDPITDDELNALLVKSLKPGANLIFFSDSCNSGSILHLPLRLTLTQLSDPSYVIDNPSELGQEDSKDIVMISGCRSDEGSGDTYENRQAQGCFTWAILSVFNDNRCLLNSISWKQLLLLVREKLISHTYQQVPQLAFSSLNYLNSDCDI